MKNIYITEVFGNTIYAVVNYTKQTQFDGILFYKIVKTGSTFSITQKQIEIVGVVDLLGVFASSADEAWCCYRGANATGITIYSFNQEKGVDDSLRDSQIPTTVSSVAMNTQNKFAIFTINPTNNANCLFFYEPAQNSFKQYALDSNTPKCSPTDSAGFRAGFISPKICFLFFRTDGNVLHYTVVDEGNETYQYLTQEGNSPTQSEASFASNGDAHLLYLALDNQSGKNGICHLSPGKDGIFLLKASLDSPFSTFPGSASTRFIAYFDQTDPLNQITVSQYDENFSANLGTQKITLSSDMSAKAYPRFAPTDNWEGTGGLFHLRYDAANTGLVLEFFPYY